MHEMAITLNAVEICEQAALGRAVTAVTLEIGDLSGVVPEAVEFCFDACTRGTLLDGAQLRIERVAGQGRCDCGKEFMVAALFDPCPSCGGYGVELLAGRELRVKELEVA
ncbi:hydrogenase maturation nickel metallochaperone HypA [Geotalea sp. SG265]|uniref:hydrogenase maturation nickel metallochaperone HypA/HybF n=1 Tax=Geotalea sp. SG265 TaxID=2922867 RepID=UPI001FAF3CCA|nr:hydrogenase maturation nickel metallochaperone HypA [Geotalea sp. SG265]